jgi:hypothetical protein
VFPAALEERMEVLRETVLLLYSLKSLHYFIRVPKKITIQPPCSDSPTYDLRITVAP